MPHRAPFALASVAALLACTACSDDDDSSGNGGTGSNGNVDFAVSCTMPTACGGDPSGTWDVVGGCVQPTEMDFDCDWERTAHGSIEGTFTFEAGSLNIETDAELRHCGWVDGSGRSTYASTVITGNTIALGTDRTLVFCVEEDTLWIWEMAATYPDFNMFELARSSN
jgi:hypothetical protein